MASREPAPDAWAGTLRAAFCEAAERCGVLQRDYRIAGQGVQMRFAGGALLDRIAGSFVHLQVVADGEPELTIHLWDSASTGTAPPPMPGAPIDGGDGTGPIYYYESGAVRAINRWSTLSVLDGAVSQAWFWAPGPDEMLSWDWASPLRAILHWWLGRHGVLQVHGGAVGVDDVGALVVGRGGSGKSTTTLACLCASLKYAGDDFVGIEVRPQPYVHSLYSSGKLESHQIERFPELLPAVANPDRLAEEKAVVYARRQFPECVTSGFRLGAVLVPRIAGGVESRVVPASPTSALAALAPSTIFQLHPPQRDALAQMAALVREVPCYSLELGSRLDAIPGVIAELLSGS